MPVVIHGFLPRHEDVDTSTPKQCEEIFLTKSGDSNHVERLFECAERARYPPAVAMGVYDDDPELFADIFPTI